MLVIKILIMLTAFFLLSAVGFGPEVGTVEMSVGWKDYTVTVASDLLKTAGLQSITIHHSQTFIPTGDTRTLAAAYDQFWFTGG